LVKLADTDGSEPSEVAAVAIEAGESTRDEIDPAVVLVSLLIVPEGNGVGAWARVFR
jgi:hypothetical protein